MSSDKKNIIFDSQILNCVQLCAQRTQFEFELDLRPPTTPEPFEEGDLLHKMMEAYYLGIKEGGYDLLYSDENFKAHVEYCLELGEKHSVSLDINSAEVAAVLYQFEKYTQHFRMDGWVPLEVERPYIVPVYDSEDLSIHYCGKIDLIANIPNFGNCVVDHKKAGRTQQPSALSNQFTGYSFATKLPNVWVNKVGFQKTLSEEQRFRRYPLFYTEDSIKRWVRNTIFWGQQYAFYLENDTWPENRTSCDKYSGCIFEPICLSATDEAREYLMRANFVKGDKWDPTAVLKKAEITDGA